MADFCFSFCSIGSSYRAKSCFGTIRYSESLYALFSIGGLYHLISGRNNIVVLWFALSGFARSNGVINAVRVWVDVAKKPDAVLWRPTSEMRTIEEALSSNMTWPADKILKGLNGGSFSIIDHCFEDGSLSYRLNSGDDFFVRAFSPDGLFTSQFHLAFCQDGLFPSDLSLSSQVAVTT
ncbi:hypothetical protein L484_016216 [Morus notabilis]|uniref:GPI mannosyltransferase 2 n=1 Tax=Morus notabilis TaxID=981085 RepID=W9SRD4_9ROSA|nr:hypothetical protein L484_016216 [Morus notabilis]